MRSPKSDLLSNNFHADVARAAHADGSSSTAAQIDYASLHERTTVVDPNDDWATITRICHSNSRAEWQRSVGGGHRTRIELLAGCGSMSRELLTIVRGNLGLGGTLQTDKRT